LPAWLDDTEDAIATLETIGGEIADLKANLAQFPAQERELIKPRWWAARASSEDWNNLVEWVDQLNGDYSLLGDYAIPPCWPAHPGVVAELAGLWRSWIHAVINDARAKKQGSSDLTAWHDRWFWPFMDRIKTGTLQNNELQEGAPCRSTRTCHRRSVEVETRGVRRRIGPRPDRWSHRPTPPIQCKSDTEATLPAWVSQFSDASRRYRSRSLICAAHAQMVAA